MDNLIELLADPADPEKSLREADKALLDRLNALIAEGRLRDRSGTVLARPLVAALVNESNDCVYPVEDGIPILLIERGIEIEKPAD